MHKLLARQLRKAAEGSPDGTVDLARLIAMVDLAYEESDRERRLKDRALDVMQAEVNEMTDRVAEEAEARFNLLMDNVGEAVIVISANGSIEAFNREAENIFKYTAEEAIGRNISFLMPPDLAAPHNSFLVHSDKHINTRIMSQDGRDLRGARKTGETFPAEIAIGEASSSGQL
ncbi:hypothetical protein MCP1_250054 [Candidatus Terasakiella magnetica]|nr:hypothetical protein MCP1_250054 [Candidatus Terasakiella magnetica]